MPLVSKAFGDIITFTRASGATWFNAAGNLVGVDFSVTSVTIGTGSKTFTLDATAGVNRSWAAGDSVLISQQSNSANNMTGTVTSYTASTQALVVDVTSTGGSGTITSWRVSSLMPRFDYDPSTLAAQGLLIEEARTNSIRNNTMVGAVAGTPGTNPNNWAVSLTANGVTQAVSAVGTENGIAYVDIRYNGTPTAGTNVAIAFEQANQIAASSGQTWTESVYVKLQAGSFTGTTTTISLLGTNGTSGTESIDSAVITSTPADLRNCRLSVSGTFANAGTTNAQPRIRIGYTVGVAIDITLRIGLPQLEQGAFATSVIPTTTTALTRAVDVASVNTLSPWFNASAGTFFIEAALATVSSYRPIAQVDDGATNNRIYYDCNSGPIRVVSRVSGVNQCLIDLASVSANTVFKVAGGYSLNDYAGSLNGAAVVTDTSATVPTVDRLRMMSDGVNQGVGYLRRITYYPRRLSNAELQAITA
jgi:hypothetical protein